MIPKLFIQNTHKYGNGVFTSISFKKGDKICILKGHQVDIFEMIKIIISGKDSLDNPLQIGTRTHLLLDKLSKTFNHSCSPNCGIRKRSELFALRDIAIGEELTYDYSVTVSPTKWSMECKCDSRDCRGVIGDILSVPKTVLSNYKESGAIQTFMKRILNRIESGSYHLPMYEIRARRMLKNMSK